MFRQKIVVCFFLVAFLVIGVRLFYWQILKGTTLAEAASDQYYFKLTLWPKRGELLAGDGNPLVTNKNAYLVYAKPQDIKDKKKFSEKVAELLHLDAAEIQERITPEHLVWVPLKRKVDEVEQQQLNQLDLSGVGFEKEGKRYYPESSMAAHLLGFIGSDENGDDKGYFGLEGYYERALKGKPGSLIQEKDARGLPILLGATKRITAEDGQNLELYIDRTVQFIIEERLKEGIVKYGAKEGLVAVMDPKTGGIIASASFPNYDPDTFQNFSKEFFTNPLISTIFEPGSIFKPLVMSAALNEKAIDPKMKFNEEDAIQVGEYMIRTWNNKYNGEVTMTQILEKSSNPGMVFVGKKLGRDKLYKYIEKFGFGQKTSIDLEGEESSQIRPLIDWKEIDFATATFGQGIAVTPIQMLRAVAALANDGQLMEPHVVKNIHDPLGKTIEIKPKKVTQVISSATAKAITEMMISAVNAGDAKWAKPKGYRIAGKTGTAQIPVAGHYDEAKTIASFVGFAPADDPKFVMLVTFREPTTSPWGSETAAPLFFAIAKELFSYYGISPKD